MSHILRVFIRHESDAQPAYIKVRSDQEPDAFLKDLEEAMQQPAPSIWRCVDLDYHTWVFRADKIYTVCVYPPEDEASHIAGGSVEVSAVPADIVVDTAGTSAEMPAVPDVPDAPETDSGTRPVADVHTYDDLDAVENISGPVKDSDS